MIRAMRRAAKSVIHPTLAPFATRAFRARAASCRTLDDALDLAYEFDFGRIRVNPVQVRSEIATFLDRLAALSPRTILEVGTANGGTLFLFTRVAAPDALLISIDLPAGHPVGTYPPWMTGLYRSFARDRQEIALVRRDSLDPATVGVVKERLAGQPVDFLFIDGDHSERSVRSDHALYSPLVRPGGMIAFHDIVPGPNSGGVPKLWSELKEGSRRSEEIVENWKQGGYGIGTIT